MDELFVIVYKLAGGKRIRLEVTSEVKELIESSDRQIRSQRRQDRRHLEKEEYEDGLDDTTIVYPHEDFADLVVRMDSYKRLYAAIEKLSETQRRRLRMRFFDGLTFRRIAEIDSVSHKTVMKSVAQAIEILRKHISK
jgi:RNA polymerase sigma factor (sigma-70 family)